MQTRKRNIDSVLNLVNPKRLKLQNSSPQKECKQKKTVFSLQKDKQSQKIQKNVSLGFVKEDGNLGKKKPEGKTPKLNISNQNNVEVIHKDEKTGTQQTTDKPFKKRPLFKEKLTKSVQSSNKDEIRDAVTVSKSLIQITSVHGSKIKVETGKVEKEIERMIAKDIAECHRDVGEKITTRECDKVNMEVKEELIRKNSETAVKGQEENNTDKNVKAIVIKVEVLPNKDSKGAPVKTEIDNTDLEDEEDDFIDSGALEDDRDEDFDISKEVDKHSSGLKDKNDKTTQIDIIDVTDIKEEGEENDAIMKKHEYRCQYCKKSFASKYSLKKHTIKHTGEKPFECKECGLCFGLNEYLKRHMEMHMEDSEKQFPCDKCSKTFPRKTALDTHKIVHQDAKPFSCPVCFKKFKRKMTLNSHFQVHKYGQIYICHYCGKSFGFKSSLQCHLIKHSDEKPYVCSICGKGYYSKQSYHDHNLRHQKIKEIECPICHHRYYNKKELRKHMTFHNTKTEFSCKPCQMYFKDANCLRIHRIKAHSNEYTCEFCNAKFSNIRIYKTHIFREHRELRNARRPKMPMHEKANFKHVLCDFCGKELSNKYRLKKHLIAKHSGMKRPKRQREPGEVREPVKLYPSGKKVLCTVCNKVMFNKYKLYKHMEKMHDIPVEEIQKIELVRFEGVIIDGEEEQKRKLGNEVDLQTIVVKPVNADSIIQDSRYDGSTVHYLDAHGNIIYTDSTSGHVYVNVNEYNKLGYEEITESNQEAVVADHNENTSEDGQTIIIDKLSSTGNNVKIAKSIKGTSFPKSIVDFAAQAAKIIDIDEGIVTQEPDTTEKLVNGKGQQIMVTYNESMTENDCCPSNDAQDITYIVQQATSRIAAHEKAEGSRSLLKRNTASTYQTGVQVIVKNSGIMEESKVDSAESNVKYIIEEGNETSSEQPFDVKEGYGEILSDVLTESSDAEQQQKIIIIDEQGGEQIISTGPSDQIRISYDPETGLYTYVAEEVIVQQEEENNLGQEVSEDGSYKWVIVSEEDQSGQNPGQGQEIINQTTQGTEVVSQNIQSTLHISSAEEVNVDNRHITEQTGKVTRQNDTVLRHYENKGTGNSLDFTSGKDQLSKITTVTHSRIDKETPMSDQRQGAGTHTDTHTAQTSQVVTKLDNYTTEIETSEILVEARPHMLKSSGEMLSKNESQSVIGVCDSSIQAIGQSSIPSSEMTASYIQETVQQPPLLHAVQETSNILSTQYTESPSFTELSSVGQPLPGTNEYSSSSKHNLVQDQYAQSVVTHLNMNDPSSHMLEEISQDVLTLGQTTETQKHDFSSITYNKSILNLDNIVPAANDHEYSDKLLNLDNVVIQTVETSGQELEPGVSDHTVIESEELCDRKDFIQLENMLKSGIRDVSNSVEYSNFLDRMIIHLQSAKENVSGNQN